MLEVGTNIDWEEDEIVEGVNSFWPKESLDGWEKFDTIEEGGEFEKREIDDRPAPIIDEVVDVMVVVVVVIEEKEEITEGSLRFRIW